MSTVPVDPNLGTTLDDRYRLDHLLAHGGMSRIYRALDKRLHRAVVVKILNDNFASERTVRERFESEAVIAANITHPNVVQIRDHNVSGNIVYLVMEYVRGRNLGDVIAERGRFTPRQTLSVLEQVCRGLSAAHAEGIIHRDMKPANVLLADTGEIKLTDFGLARAASAHTQSATLVATLSHVSPELVSGAPADSRSDIYAVGIMIYQMLTGRLPYSETNAAALMKHHLDSPMPMPSSLVPGLAADMDELVQWCTEKDPERRPQNAGLLLEEVIQIHSTLTDEQLDLDAETLGTVADLTPQTLSPMPTTLQERLDAMQREREQERERQWLASQAAAQAADYDGEDAEGVDPEATTVIPAGDATEVLNLQDAQATEVFSRDAEQSTVVYTPTPAASDRTTSYSRQDLESFAAGQGQPDGQQLEAAHQPAAHLSARERKRAEKQADRRWRKEAQIPTHRLQKPRSGTQKTVVTLVWLFVVALVAAAGWFFGRGPGTVLRIPSLTGLLQSQAVAELDGQGIPVRISSVYDDEVAIGRVVDSNPASGENIMRFQGVDLSISQGPEQFEIPDVSGQSPEAAEAALADAGLPTVTRSEEYSASVSEGEVIETSPAAGDTAARKDTVTIIISQGPAPVKVPSLIGLDREAAQAALRELGLTLQVGDEVYSNDVAAGLVAAQDPQGGTVEVGSDVTVNLSAGPEYIQVPSVLGMSVEQAVQTLEEAGFTVTTHNVLGGLTQRVGMQSPLNRSAPSGSQVDIYAF